MESSWGSTIKIGEIVDGNDYNIFDERLKALYMALIGEKAKSIDSAKAELEADSFDTLEKCKLTGNIKLLILKMNDNVDNYDGRYFFGSSPLYSGVNLETKPKYIAVVGQGNINGFGRKISSDIEYDTIYNQEWNKQIEKVKETKTAIYRWDSTENKYIFESADTLEDWLKEHPLDTL